MFHNTEIELHLCNNDCIRSENHLIALCCCKQHKQDRKRQASQPYLPTGQINFIPRPKINWHVNQETTFLLKSRSLKPNPAVVGNVGAGQALNWPQLQANSMAAPGSAVRMSLEAMRWSQLSSSVKKEEINGHNCSIVVLWWSCGLVGAKGQQRRSDVNLLSVSRQCHLSVTEDYFTLALGCF